MFVYCSDTTLVKYLHIDGKEIAYFNDINACQDEVQRQRDLFVSLRYAMDDKIKRQRIKRLKRQLRRAVKPVAVVICQQAPVDPRPHARVFDVEVIEYDETIGERDYDYVSSSPTYSQASTISNPASPDIIDNNSEDIF